MKHPKIITTTIYVALLLFGSLIVPVNSQDHGPPSEEEMMEMMMKMAALDAPRGLIVNSKEATKGYKLYSPLASDMFYLINNDGDVVHTWKMKYGTGPAYLMDNGDIYTTGRDPEAVVFAGGGLGGYILKYDWDGNLLWEYKYSTEYHLSHHDIAVMPNGNVLAIAWEAKTVEECIKAGRNPEEVPKAGLWPDSVVEIEPDGPSGGRVVWEWHAWDHMIQNFDKSLPNYGDPAEHPELIDINLNDIPKDVTEEDVAKQKAIGFAHSTATVDNRGSDIYHCNAIEYNADLDQIAISSPNLGEVFIIDHSTTAAEASGHTGGNAGHGGDLLYRWGNPDNYGRGDAEDKRLGEQHDVRWIPEGRPGAGNLTIFNNMTMGPKGPYSQVVEIETPINTDGSYAWPANGPIGPEIPVWSYMAKDTASFFAPFISSAERLASGNTLVNSGPQGRFFEVTPDNEIVWEYWMPYSGDLRTPDGARPQPIGPFLYASFRSNHFSPKHPAFKGRKLKPMRPQPEIIPAKMD